MLRNFGDDHFRNKVSSNIEADQALSFGEQGGGSRGTGGRKSEVDLAVACGRV